jgi:formate dehydrogenase iron-sulfur subunit
MPDSTKSLISAKQLIAEALAEQRLVTPVAEFSRRQSAGEGSGSRYQDLIPLSQPGPGEQYAFTVDLDACSGCKACVSACHSLNGLDEEETWREVGLLFGATADGPVLQTITTACHHCLDPACQLGCPVKAYDKDPVTGIVRHLDDQCIGCQYCIFKCPYDVPKYSTARGIVRKCDMCHQRLGAGEAPACVQSCPTHAIRITKISRAEAEARSQSPLVPGAADSRYTKPTTRYLRKTPLPADLETPPERAIKREHAHAPLVAMLSLTQWSLGCFLILLILNPGTLRTNGSSSLPFIALAVIGAFTVLAGIGASLFHLGRPWHAWKAFLGFRTSWLSREIVVFGGYGTVSLVWSIWFLRPDLLGISPAWGQLALAAVVTSGMAAVYCSIMVYVDTRRPFWRWSLTAPKFMGTALLLGFGTGFLVSDRDPLLAAGFALVSAIKLGFEINFLLVHARSSDRSPDRRSTLVMFRACGRTLAWRLMAGTIGGVVIPILALNAVTSFNLKLAALGLAVFGEILERVLFFEAVIPGRMPGIAQRNETANG